MADTNTNAISHMEVFGPGVAPHSFCSLGGDIFLSGLHHLLLYSMQLTTNHHTMSYSCIVRSHVFVCVCVRVWLCVCVCVWL